MLGNREAGGEEREEGITKRCEEAFASDEHVHYFDCGDSFMSVYICENLSDCILQRYAVYPMTIIPE